MGISIKLKNLLDRIPQINATVIVIYFPDGPCTSVKSVATFFSLSHSLCLQVIIAQWRGFSYLAGKDVLLNFL